MKPYYNKVLFAPDYGSENFKIDEMVLQADASYIPGAHQPITGTIVGLPDKLIYGNDDTLEFDTDINVQIGDKAIVGFFDVFQALEQHHTAQDAIFLRYDSLICVKRGEVFIPVNGRIIASAMKPYDLSEYENLYKRKFHHDVRIAKVKHVGQKVREYYFTKESDGFDVEVGDVVVLDNYCDLPVENEGRELFFGEKTFYFHRTNILGRL